MTEVQSKATPVITLKAETFGAVEFPKDVIDSRVFEQLLQLDEGTEFVRTVVDDYFEQAERTIEKMQKAVKRKDFAKLSDLGHFLKGSSAAVGIIKMKTSCGKLQHYGDRRDAEGINSITDEEARKLIEKLLIQMQTENEEARNNLARVLDEREI
ncbi:hypothetical protein BGZ75_009169 [Mortierella antarctica]|nr:hypothetical protein BGZ67_008865 [Mortierella alpina]KAF9979831.1 hypothetical protein BGZ75_009169 [Mortierella antarctica]